ncbi:hypothetical protein A2Y85_01110 [candidate division WOR-3 bacterium RBG_13_43_14]|uniref:FMN-binding domain-containing protein n=1 Tax=candidate division WOR-3 bacterium RBG_13_43_14 TaxID=1802590 RepID=A0A1F4UFR8_UNCW3|nr:MAG: hypothetical protein A2Y85_01110 [candidate division WOR-3 bacterium RBG_13_43_14]
MTNLILIIFSSLCVWRFPERDMKEIFNGDSYQTTFFDISADDQEKIEELLGTALDADETQFKFFTVFKDGDTVGTVATHLSKGQYGAIEVVVALEQENDPRKFTIKEVRIQRDREKDRVNLRSQKFLGQFVGKNSQDPLLVGDDLKPASENSIKSSTAIALAVKKLTVIFDYLVNKE